MPMNMTNKYHNKFNKWTRCRKNRRSDM